MEFNHHPWQCVCQDDILADHSFELIDDIELIDGNFGNHLSFYLE